MRALIMVTKDSHCLRDLLFLLELGEIPIGIPLVMSNHDELRSLVDSHGIKFTSMEAPSLNNDVAHVTHTSTSENLVSLERDIERRVLSKSV